jgi:hypothetical protein
MESHRFARTRRIGRRVRKALLAPVVVMALLAAAVPAGASCLNRSTRSATSARTAAIAREHAHTRSHRHQGWIEFLRKVG